MPLDWFDVSAVPFNALLLLEQVQLTWFRTWRFPEPDLCLALAGNPHVVWYLRHKCPDLNDWVDAELAKARELQAQLPPLTPAALRSAEVNVLNHMQDLLVYVLDPAVYDTQPFTAWDSRELSSLVDFHDKIVVDVGAGTGRLAFVAAPWARTVYAVEPVGNLRRYIRQQARLRGFHNVYAVDGLITDIPFPDNFAGVLLAGHVYGDDPTAEIDEMLRVVCPGGWVVLCPGNGDFDNPAHRALLERGFLWSRFEEPRAGLCRKYWKEKEADRDHRA